MVMLELYSDTKFIISSILNRGAIMRKTIGFYGAVGTYDFGDNAMMVKNIENFYSCNSELDFVIFTPDVPVTKYHCEMLIDKMDLLQRISIVGDGIKFMNPVDIEEHGVKLRVFESDKLNSKRLENIKTLWQETYSNDLSSVNKELLKHLQNIDVLVFNGGGYLYDGWGDRVIYFMAYINMAHALKKPIYFLGNSFGPLNEEYQYYFSKSLKFVETILVRDGKHYSNVLLNSLGIEDNIIVGTDDMVHECRVLPLNERNNHIIIEVMGSVAENEEYCKKYVSEIKKFISCVTQNNYQVYLINFGKKDRIANNIIHEIKDVFIDDDVKTIFEITNIHEVLSLFQNAKFTVSVRYHPLVFSLGSMVQCVSLLTGKTDYYYRKMYGCFESLGLNGDSSIINLNSISADYLIDAMNHELIIFDKLTKYSLREEHSNYIKKIACL